MLIRLPTPKTGNDAATALHLAVQANHFGVMQVHNLNETMAATSGGNHDQRSTRGSEKI